MTTRLNPLTPVHAGLACVGETHSAADVTLCAVNTGIRGVCNRAFAVMARLPDGDWQSRPRHKMDFRRNAPLPPGPRWHIRVQRRCEYNGLYPPNDWRGYREFLDWPITFASATAAQSFMEQCFTFEGITGSKVSASVRQCGPTRAPRGQP